MTEQPIPEATLPDGRLRCQGIGVKGQCKNEAGWKTDHVATGNCTYHDKDRGKVEILGIGAEPEDLRPSKSNRKPIYDRGLAETDPTKLYRELSEGSNAASLQLHEELAMARSTLLRLQTDMTAGRLETKDFYTESSRLLDTISKLVERSQPKSTLTISNVQNVLMKVIEVVHQEVNDTLVIERIIQKLSGITVVKQ